MLPSQFKTPAPASMNSLLPAFKFTEAVETGGGGAVYFAIQKSLDRLVAIKLFPHALGEGDGSLQSFEKVASAAAQLKHPNLISIFDSGRVGGIPYLVMEFVPGRSLARSTGGRAVDFEQAVGLMKGICDGLACAHAKGIVHGNLDLSNILLNKKAEPKVGNFGFERLDHAEPSPYAAPELLDGTSTFTMRSDVYAVAAIFRELLTGSPPGPGAPSFPALPPGGEKLALLVEQAMDPDPGKRMADVLAFREALNEAAASGKPDRSQPKIARPSHAPLPGRKPTPVTQVGTDRGLVMKAVIIVLLLFGIHFVWKILKSTRAERERENLELLANDAAKDEEIRADATRMMAQKPANSSRETLVPEGTGRTESPGESLERLRVGLASGKRSEMPEGTLRRGESDYFFVSEPMNWPDASLFAESLGAHLAIPAEDSDALWLASEVAKSSATWIGVGRNGEESWVTVAGDVWDPGAESLGAGQYLAVESGGVVRAKGREAKHPFIIQWHTDGSNPGTIDARLAAAGTSRGQGQPVFPAGTVTLGSRHFLYVARPVAWQEADRMAGTAGGHLMVVSANEEAGFLRKQTEPLSAPDGIWLGASLAADHWRWITGEPWMAADWAKGADSGSDGYSLVIHPGKGWDSRDNSKAASGFIIEWSEDSMTATSGKTEVTAPAAETAELLAKAKEVILAADKKHNEALAENARKFSWDLDAFVRGLSSGGKASWGPEVNRLKTCVKDDRLLAGKAKAQGIRISPEMSKIAEYAVRKEGEIDAKFSKSLSTIRDLFVSKMTAIHDSAIQSGQSKAAESADQAIAAAKDLTKWLEQFGLKLPR